MYAVIRADSRHTHLIELYNKPIETRSFADWLMSNRVLSATDLEQLGDLFAFEKGLLGGQIISRTLYEE